MKVIPINRGRAESIEQLSGYIEEHGGAWRAAMLIYYDEVSESVGCTVAGVSTVLEAVSWLELLKNQLLNTLQE